MPLMNRFDWARLNHMQVGRYAEIFRKDGARIVWL
jgi:hypothetical protein